MSRNGRLAFSGTGSSGRSSFTATGNVDGRTCVSISRVKLLQSMAASSKDAANRCAVILCRKGAKTKAGGAKLVYRFRVGGLVLANLVAEKIVNGIERGWVGGLDDHAGAVGGFLIGVHDFLAQALHRGRARGDRIVDEHRKRKISLGKLARDMRQMSPNDVAVRCVRGILDLNLNHAAVGLQQKMVYRGVL